MASVNLTIKTDADYLRLLGYRYVLREIAKSTDPWDPVGQVARDVLAHFGDEEEEA